MTRPIPHPVRGVVFDLDGTLTVPMLDFDAMRAEIGTNAVPLLEALEHMTESERRRAWGIIERHENEAALRSELSDGARELLAFLREASIRIGLVTRNSRLSVETFSQRHGITFDVVVTRDDAPPKPSPEPLRRALAAMHVQPREAIYVGDFEMDRLTGDAAGVTTYIVQHHPSPRDNGPADLRIQSLADLIPLVSAANTPGAAP